MESANWNSNPGGDTSLPSALCNVFIPITNIPQNTGIPPFNFQNCSKHGYCPFAMTYIGRLQFIEKAWEEQNLESLEEIYREELNCLMIACAMVPFGDWTVKEPPVENFKPFMNYFFYHMGNVIERTFLKTTNYWMG